MTAYVPVGILRKAKMYTAQIFTSSADALTAVGTNRATALALTKKRNRISTAASGTGASLPAAKAGMSVTILHDGVSNIKVYALGSDTIDGVAGATGVTLTAAARCDYHCLADGKWYSALLGATSA